MHLCIIPILVGHNREKNPGKKEIKVWRAVELVVKSLRGTRYARIIMTSWVNWISFHISSAFYFSLCQVTVTCINQRLNCCFRYKTLPPSSLDAQQSTCLCEFLMCLVVHHNGINVIVIPILPLSPISLQLWLPGNRSACESRLKTSLHRWIM